MADDNYGPAVRGSVSPTYPCMRDGCGAMVVDRTRHDEWHAKNPAPVVGVKHYAARTVAELQIHDIGRRVRVEVGDSVVTGILIEIAAKGDTQEVVHGTGHRQTLVTGLDLALRVGDFRFRLDRNAPVEMLDGPE